MTAAEAEASTCPLSERFIKKLRSLIGEEIGVSVTDRFADRLRDLCAEEQRELAANSDGWKQGGF